MLGNANHTASVCTVKTADDTKGGQKGHLERNVLGIIKKREIKIIQRTHFSPTPATVESSQLILLLYKKKKMSTARSSSYLSRSSGKNGTKGALSVSIAAVIVGV